MLEFSTVQCPYCWSSMDIAVDLSAGDAEYVEDCQVCCQPIRLTLALGGGEYGDGFRLEAEREND